ncbi:MAG: twin-arginine translocation signal domain-containing protein [Bryobacterales bacterium]|nr:twin-arginine translocation signal domain-containing protein [Bryobacterales bacterium]
MNRRDFLKAGTAVAATGVFAQDRKRPNIVLIMADDMGFSDIGCYGSEIETPNLDRLAANGLRFTQFYNGARCCPTRAALMTGLYSHQAGVGHMVENRGTPAYQGYLNDRCLTIAEALRAGGYRTAMAGKWHVGEDRPHWPVDRGFERSFTLISGASNYFRLDEGRKMAIGDQPFTPSGRDYYMTDAFTDHAVKFIDEFGRSKDTPFFLYLPYTAPHWPLHALPEDIAKYRGKYMKGWDTLREERRARQLRLGVVEEKWPLTPRDPDAPAWNDVRDKDAFDLKMAVYAAQIDRLDRGVGRVMAKIKELGAEDNTLVLFLADNGGCAEEKVKGENIAAPGPADSFTSYGLPWANASNTPFRLYKHWVHEGGISSPLIAHWPSVIKAKNSITNQPGHLIDIMATCLDAAGAAYPATYKGKPVTPLEGKSLLPVFEGRRRAGHEAIYWEHEGNRAVRQGRWKLVARFGGGWELYDLEADRTELKNLAGADPARVKAMQALWDKWAAKVGVEPWGKRNGGKKA